MKHLAALFLLFPALCLAGTVSVSWVAPDSDVNGQPIDTVQSYAIVMTRDNEELTPIIIPGDQTNHEIQNVGAGSYSLYMTATASGVQSQPSQVVTFTVSEIAPIAPAAPSIIIQFNGFEVEGLEVR